MFCMQGSAEDATGDLPQENAELAPKTPEAGLSEDHAWRIRVYNHTATPPPDVMWIGFMQLACRRAT